ncbi:MAG: SPFH domain-containing protein [Planctomycetota bacterium]
MAQARREHDGSERRDQPREDPSGAISDAASRSLADALRVSFRLLTIIMFFVVLAFALSGFAAIEDNERGIVRIFGRIVRPVGPGRVLTWPYPIGSIETESATMQELVIEDFWMHETPEEKTLKLDQRTLRSEGLRPLWDGAVLTGDRYLVHVKLKCIYEIADPVKYKLCFADPEAAIRSIVCGAVNRAAAVQTADSLMSEGKEAFRNDVRKIARGQLEDELDSGIRMADVQTIQITWPLRALPDYAEVSVAINESQEKIGRAKGEAKSILLGAAGAAANRLVGSLEQVIAGSRERAEDGENLIGQYIDARAKLEKALYAYNWAKGKVDAGDEEVLRAEVFRHRTKADKLLSKIDATLVSNETEGRARSLIREARSYRDRAVQRLLAWHETFLDVAPECRTTQATAFLFRSKWAEARGKMLSSPTNEKYLLPPTEEKLILVIPREAEFLRNKMIELRKLAQKARAGGESMR